MNFRFTLVWSFYILLIFIIVFLSSFYTFSLCRPPLETNVIFCNLQESTIGAAFFTQVLSLNEATIKFDIWDTAGQERYHSLAPMYYRGAAAAIVVYDITSMVYICQTPTNLALGVAF